MEILDVKDFLIDEACTMLDAMEKLNKVGKKALFVVREGEMVAALTDGDIRRWILKKGDVHAKVSDIANYDPKYVYEEDGVLARQYMDEYSVDALPVLNANNEIVRIVMRDDTVVRMRHRISVPVVIMAGGLGTRLHPYTRILPKPLIPINGVPIVERIMDDFNKYGVDEFFLVLNHKRNMVKAYFSDISKTYRINYIEEEEPLDTGGGLSLLKGKIRVPFILSNCDILVAEDYGKIYEHHKTQGNLITIVCALKRMEIPYGVVQINAEGELEKMTEKPEISFLTNTGMYVVEPEVIDQLEENRVVSFPEIILEHRRSGHRIGIYPVNEYDWLDMGQLDELERMRLRLEKDE